MLRELWHLGNRSRLDLYQYHPGFVGFSVIQVTLLPSIATTAAAHH
jgi:hypothetical protein